MHNVYKDIFLCLFFIDNAQSRVYTVSVLVYIMYRHRKKLLKGLFLMKKFLCILLSVVMMLSGLSVLAFAAEDEEAPLVVDELILESVLKEEAYYHIDYTRSNGYFDSTIALYSALNLYEDGIYNGITGSNDYKVAKATLLGLVERVDIPYENELIYKILDILDTTRSVADVIDTISEYISAFEVVTESSEWNTTMQVITEFQRYLSYGNDLYEEYIDAVAEIVTVKSAGLYFEELLNQVADTARDQVVRNAARDLANNIDAEIEKAFGAVALKVTEDLAKEAINIAIDELSSLNTVTAILSKIYSAIGDIAQFLFNTQDQYEYMTALSTIVTIEDVLPAYVRDKVVNTKAESGEFALNALITLRTEGERMLLNLERVKRDAIAGSIFNGYHVPEIIERTAVQVAKLEALKAVFDKGAEFKTVAIFVTAAPTAVTVYNEVGDVMATISNTEAKSVYSEKGYFASVYDDIYGGYIKVAFVFDTACKTALFRTAEPCDMNLAYEGFVLNEKTNKSYFDVFYFQGKYLNAVRFIRLDLAGWTTAPTYTIVDSENGNFARVMVTDYDSENEGLIYENDVDTGDVEKEEPKDEGVVNADGLWAVIANFFKDLFQKISDFFNNLFG